MFCFLGSHLNTSVTVTNLKHAQAFLHGHTAIFMIQVILRAESIIMLASDSAHYAHTDPFHITMEL